MTASRQLPLDLGHRPSLSGVDFLVAPSNAAAVAWIDRWPEWPGPALALSGPPGCGKSHLANVWCARSGAVTLDRRLLAQGDPHALLGPARACVVDGMIGGEADAARALLHLFNILAEAGGSMLLTDRRPPAHWPIALADLRSRLAAAPSVAIERPDDALFEAVLVKLFGDRQLRVGAEVVRYMVTRMERSFEAARRFVHILDAAALAGQRPITVPLVRRMLDMAERQ